MNAQTFSLAMGEISDKYINEAINYTAAAKPTQQTVRHFHFSKRAAVIVAIIAVLLTTACSVNAFREAITEFFIGISERCYDFFVEENNSSPDTIEQRYCFVTYPEGFEEISNEVKEHLTFAIQELQNADGDTIVLSQAIGDVPLAIDSEHGTLETLDVNGMEVLLYVYGKNNAAFWVNGPYFFNLAYYGDIDTQSMIELIEMIEIQEN